MKHVKKLARLQGRVTNWESNSVIRQGNQSNPGSYKKPGSQKR